MDKADFIRLAPAYYELAVILILQHQAGHISEEMVQDEYTETEGDGVQEAQICFVPHGALLRRAISSLVKARALDAIPDHFGPTQYKKSPDGFAPYVDRLTDDTDSPYYKSGLSPNRTRWLKQALARVNQAYSQLGITEEDFQNPDREWEPIPLDQTSEPLQTAIRAVDKTAKDVEEHNGYNSQHPQERNFVLENLRRLSETLKKAKETSLGYVRRNGLDVLKRVADRFGGAAVGEGAKHAYNALVQWLKTIVDLIF